eukprot:c4748_g1_i1.p1 GENE.c4748_g1_i1~~c4748_g1_i1.p1  ORF type:complete len:704 (+),score=173.98 c4748_g1_i1:181-2292(+)
MPSTSLTANKGYSVSRMPSPLHTAFKNHKLVNSAVWHFLVFLVVGIDILALTIADSSLTADVLCWITDSIVFAVFAMEILLMFFAYGSKYLLTIAKFKMDLIILIATIANRVSYLETSDVVSVFEGAQLGCLIVRLCLVRWDFKVKNTEDHASRCLSVLSDLKSRISLGMPIDVALSHEDVDFLIGVVSDALFSNSVRDLLEHAAVDTDQRRFLQLLYSEPSTQDSQHSDVEAPKLVRSLSRRTSLRNAADESAPNAALDAFLQTADEWKFDIFKAQKLSSGHALVAVGMYVFDSLDLMQTFRISPITVREWLTNVEKGYHDNPYHNSVHAADVLQSVYFFLVRAELMKQLSALEVFACVVSAIIHDYGHIGLTNNFLKLTSHELALTYNDISILEQFHASQGWKLCVDSRHNIFANLSVPQLAEVRQLVMDMVLDTDMAKHSRNTSTFANRVLSGINLSAPEDRKMVLCTLLHVVDLSNGVRPFKISRQWSVLVMNEFFNQGDREKELNLPVTPNMDRDGGDALIAKCQMTFLLYVVLPLYTEWFAFLRYFAKSNQTNEAAMCATMLETHLAANIEQWKDEYKRLCPEGQVPPTPISKNLTTFNVRRRTWTINRQRFEEGRRLSNDDLIRAKLQKRPSDNNTRRATFDVTVPSMIESDDDNTTHSSNPSAPLQLQSSSASITIPVPQIPSRVVPSAGTYVKL